MEKKKDILREMDAEAMVILHRIIHEARFGALGVIDRETGGPSVTRVAVGWDGSAPLILVSSLAPHTGALEADPRCSLLLGEPAEKGDPLTHPRLTLHCRAELADKEALREAWLRDHPKTKLYYDFPDFRMNRLVMLSSSLNGGFARAYRPTPAEIIEAASAIAPAP